jgi:hypothetical protein
MAADASRRLAVSTLIRPRGLAHLDTVVDRIEREVRDHAAAAPSAVSGSTAA